MVVLIALIAISIFSFSNPYVVEQQAGYKPIATTGSSSSGSSNNVGGFFGFLSKLIYKQDSVDSRGSESGGTTSGINSPGHGGPTTDDSDSGIRVECQDYDGGNLPDDPSWVTSPELERPSPDLCFTPPTKSPKIHFRLNEKICDDDKASEIEVVCDVACMDYNQLRPLPPRNEFVGACVPDLECESNDQGSDPDKPGYDPKTPGASAGLMGGVFAEQKEFCIGELKVYEYYCKESSGTVEVNGKEISYATVIAGETVNCKEKYGDEYTCIREPEWGIGYCGIKPPKQGDG